MPRPFELEPLFHTQTTLSGIGPKTAPLLERLVGGSRIIDLIKHKPCEVIDRRFSPALKDAPDGKIATLDVRVEKYTLSPRRGLPSRVTASDETGSIDIVFFNATQDWIKKQLPMGQSCIISGKVEHYQGKKQMVHPDMIGKPEDITTIKTLEPIYPLTAGITNKLIRKAIQSSLDLLPVLPEWLEEQHKKKNNWPNWKEAITTLHTPSSPTALEANHPARTRLAYDELLANQLALALVRLHQSKQNGRSWECSQHLRQAIYSRLPFTLTTAQQRCLSEIDKDMLSPYRMLRLLQGDVGSGKTIVAALAMMSVIEAGAQAAIMAPTEILARQHEISFKEWLTAAGVSCVTLTGRNKGKEREAIVEQIKSGEAKVIIGTHALFQESIEFKDLGLVIIDEQHRFGVHQRLSLSQKSKGTDVLVMTATPIPRTLTLTAYGDMEVSRIDQKPQGRKPIETRLIPIEKSEDMMQAIRSQIQNGTQVYWVCPLVEESEKLDLQAAEARYDILKEHYGTQVGLVHGRMKPAEKDAVMESFHAGHLKILVATTVIEVGVNVPNASIMVIEQAERFGLAQLHQLRGRVGRGNTQSFCFLLYASSLTDTAKERLRIMRETEDGFLIAEKDLELRGGGEVLGTRQSGLPEFHFADLSSHGDLLVAARQDSQIILGQDDQLETKRGQALKTLLYLFEQDQAISRLRAG